MRKRLAPSLLISAVILLVLGWRLPTLLGWVEGFVDARLEAALGGRLGGLGLSPRDADAGVPPARGIELPNGMVLFTPAPERLTVQERMRIVRRAISLAPLKTESPVPRDGEGEMSDASPPVRPTAPAGGEGIGGETSGTTGAGGSMSEAMMESEEVEELLRRLLEGGDG